MAFGILALMVASLFTGAAIYVTVVEHPARSCWWRAGPSR
jgi:hypothetical protein